MACKNPATARLFEDTGALTDVAKLASRWFDGLGIISSLKNMIVAALVRSRAT